MRIKANSGEIDQLTKKNDEYNISLYEEIQGCVEIINHLKENYKSAESEYVIETCEAYVDNLKVVPFTLNELNNVTRKANRTYDEKDSEFLRDLQKEEIRGETNA